MKTISFRIGFWVLLSAFIAWDVMHSAPIDMRAEPPMIAAGSGKPLTLGHCSATGMGK